MKRIISVMAILAILFSVLGACKEKIKPETTTSPAPSTSTTAEKTIEATTVMTETTRAETTTENQTSKVNLTGKNNTPETEDDFQVKDTEKYIAYKFEFEIEGCQKTEYEKNYSSEVLTEIYELIPMCFGLTFGYDDYDNWDGTPNTVLNDIYHSMGYWMIDCYDYDSEEIKRASEELNANPYGHENREGFYTSVEKINAFLREVYGPDARVFKAEDFDTYDEIKTSEESVFINYDYSFRFVYLPESDIVRCFARETWGGETEGICVCDVRMSNGDYIAEVVFNTYYGYRAKYIMTMSCESNGNIYVKNVEDFYILPDGAKNNIKVISEDVEVKYRKYNSGNWVIVDTLSVGDEVYSTGGTYENDDYVWIVTEEYRGRVEKKYVTEIE